MGGGGLRHHYRYDAEQRHAMPPFPFESVGTGPSMDGYNLRGRAASVCAG
jgi:hypothetical protein